ncbi:hypothetical protein C8R46DRAFT_1309604 [Mycena filopes]|nr:hypothetical protein C8R46DRAFT_1309604 [Mycena filopes]
MLSAGRKTQQNRDNNSSLSHGSQNIYPPSLHPRSQFGHPHSALWEDFGTIPFQCACKVSLWEGFNNTLHRAQALHISQPRSKTSSASFSPTKSISPRPASVTSVVFNTNPVAPSGASMETLVLGGSTTVIEIPSATTIIPLGHPVVSIVTGSSLDAGPSTILHPEASTITQGVGLTLGPGGGIIGAVPTSVSQPGFVPPVFRHLLDPRFSTAVPIPTSSSSTVLIGALFGGGSIILGPGGTIVGSLPAGISEAGGVHPVPIPVGDAPPEHPTPTHSRPTVSHTSTSASASASSSATCSRRNVTTCGSTCYPEDSAQYFYASDGDEDDDTDPLSRWWPTFFLRALSKRGNPRHIASRRASGGQKYPTLASTSSAVSQFEGSGPRPHFDFASKDGSDFDVKETTVTGSKPTSEGYITEHLFEFQIFTQFINKILKNSRLRDFYDPQKTPEAQAIVNRIDSVKNLVYTNDWINTAKLNTIANAAQVGKAGLDNWVDPKAREKLESLMIALGVLPNYLNENAAAMRKTAVAIIAQLQKYELRTGTNFNPPLAVQFYNFYTAEISEYASRAQKLALNLMERYNQTMKANPVACALIDPAKHCEKDSS